MTIDYVKNGPVATFTLRNGSVNPITGEMHRLMHGALVDFLADPDLKVAILTGAGERAFSAGDDVRTGDPAGGDRVGADRAGGDRAGSDWVGADPAVVTRSRTC